MEFCGNYYEGGLLQRPDGHGDLFDHGGFGVVGLQPQARLAHDAVSGLDWGRDRCDAYLFYGGEQAHHGDEHHRAAVLVAHICGIVLPDLPEEKTEKAAASGGGRVFSGTASVFCRGADDAEYVRERVGGVVGHLLCGGVLPVRQAGERRGGGPCAVPYHLYRGLSQLHGAVCEAGV